MVRWGLGWGGDNRVRVVCLQLQYMYSRRAVKMWSKVPAYRTLCTRAELITMLNMGKLVTVDCDAFHSCCSG